MRLFTRSLKSKNIQKYGIVFRSGGVEWSGFPIIAVLSGDYEEMYVLSQYQSKLILILSL